MLEGVVMFLDFWPLLPVPPSMGNWDQGIPEPGFCRSWIWPATLPHTPLPPNLLPNGPLVSATARGFTHPHALKLIALGPSAL